MVHATARKKRIWPSNLRFNLNAYAGNAGRLDDLDLKKRGCRKSSRRVHYFAVLTLPD